MAVTKTKKRTCPVCDKKVEGRSDKIFCSPYCKSANQYYSRTQHASSMFKTIDDQLKLNRRLLKKYNAGGLATVRKPDIEQQGFDPNYFTHYYRTKDNKVYLFCYEFGFRLVEQNKYLLIQWQPYMNKTKK